VSAVATAERPRQVAAPQRPPKRRRWTRFILPTYTGLFIFYLILPILIIIVYSFNDTSNNRVTFNWQGATTYWYRHVFDLTDLTSALKVSLLLAAVSTVIATAMGTLIALALVRYRFRGKGSADIVMFANIAAPEIVLGASLLALFVTFHVTRGFGTLLIAHVMFNIAYVAITVRARLIGFDRSLEEAAQDLGADPWVTFYKVTLPIIWPGVLAGALLAFALSIDDLIISGFVNGKTTTFPLWIYGAVKTGIAPQVFVMGTLIFMAGVFLAVGNVVWQRRKV
jgi:spermidine/putrescine transport system permease protein